MSVMMYVVMRVNRNPCMVRQARCKFATDTIGPLSISDILISRIKKKRGRQQKQHETSEYGIRWSIAILTVTSPIVINVPTRGLLAVKTKDSLVLWLAKFKYQKTCLWTVSIAIWGTHSTAALALYFRKVFSLKRAQVQRNKRNSAGSLREVSASQRCSNDISLS